MSDNPGTKQQKESTPPGNLPANDPTQAADAALPEKDLDKVSGGAPTTDYPNLRENISPN